MKLGVMGVPLTPYTRDNWHGKGRLVGSGARSGVDFTRRKPAKKTTRRHPHSASKW